MLGLHNIQYNNNLSEISKQNIVDDYLSRKWVDEKLCVEVIIILCNWLLTTKIKFF